MTVYLISFANEHEVKICSSRERAFSTILKSWIEFEESLNVTNSDCIDGIEELINSYEDDSDTLGIFDFAIAELITVDE